MRLNDYQKVYDKISVSKETDKKIMQNVLSAKRKSVRKPALRVACAIAAVIVIGVFQIPAVSAATKELLAMFTDMVTIRTEKVNGDGKKEVVTEEVEMKGEYLKINADAGKKDKKLDSIDEAEKEIGIDLLEPKDAYEEEYCTTYTPYLSENDTVYGVMLQNDFCSLGDIVDVETSMKKEWSYGNEIFYRAGKEYKSPISMQIVIRTDENKGVDYQNHELEYKGLSEEYLDGKDEVCVYEVQSLGVKAVITTPKTDGIIAWVNLDGEAITSCTDALLVYEGVEYRYIGAVSQGVMKEFLEGLSK